MMQEASGSKVLWHQGRRSWYAVGDVGSYVHCRIKVGYIIQGFWLSYYNGTMTQIMIVLVIISRACTTFLVNEYA